MKTDFEDHCWKDVISADTLEIYARYRRATFVGPKPAILAIDLFNKVYDGGSGPILEADRRSPGACGEYAWNAIEPTKRLLAAARAAGAPIVYTTSPSDQIGKLRATNRVRTAPTANLDPWAIREDFSPEPGDLVIIKERASAFFGTPLQAYLQKMDIDSLVVCGETTSGCVRATVVDGYSHGFHVTVAEECTFDRSLLCHEVNLFDMHHKYADVMHVDEIIGAIGKL
jgi:nicotinamidase-related amidase